MVLGFLLVGNYLLWMYLLVFLIEGNINWKLIVKVFIRLEKFIFCIIFLLFYKLLIVLIFLC